MKKILVTTDFSEESKAGLLFAIQLATQEFDLTFFNAYHILTPTSWNPGRVQSYEQAQAKLTQERLNMFVKSVYESLKIEASNLKCIIEQCTMPQTSIMQYAVEHSFDFICISTRGAGKVKKIFGTNTGNLINHSTVTVIAVPYNYKTVPITSILYASDLVHFKNEILKVVALAKPLGATLDLLHFRLTSDSSDQLGATETAVKEIAAYDVNFIIVDRNPNESLIPCVEGAIKERQPSMMIMFTDQSRTLFDRIFNSSKSEEYSFNATVPLLVFNKLDC